MEQYMPIINVVIILSMIYFISILYNTDKYHKRESNRLESENTIMSQEVSNLKSQLGVIENRHLGDIRKDLLEYLDSIIQVISDPYIDINIRHGNTTDLNGSEPMFSTVKLRSNTEMVKDMDFLYEEVIKSMSTVYKNRMHLIFSDELVYSSIINNKIKAYYTERYVIISDGFHKWNRERKIEDERFKKDNEKKIKKSHIRKIHALNTILQDTNLKFEIGEPELSINKKLEYTKSLCNVNYEILNEMEYKAKAGVSNSVLAKTYGRDSMALYLVRKLMGWTRNVRDIEFSESQVFIKDYEEGLDTGRVNADGILVRKQNGVR